MAGRPQKYLQLQHFLKQKAEECRTSGVAHLDMRIDRIKDLGIALPASAYKHKEWWANVRNSGYGAEKPLRPWQRAGFDTEKVDLKNRTLTFRYTGKFSPDVIARQKAEQRDAAQVEKEKLQRELAAQPKSIMRFLKKNQLADAEKKSHALDDTAPPRGMEENGRPYVVSDNDAPNQSHCRHPLYGALKGHIRLIAGIDLTEPADPEWGERAWGEGGQGETN